jgi:hypothetical protein
MVRATFVLALCLTLVTAGCLGYATSGEGVQEAGDGSPGTSPEGGSDRQDDRPSGNRTADPEDGNETGWPPVAEAVIRPGVRVHDEICTSSFLFRTPDNGTLYLSTSAHCVDEEEVRDPVAVGERVAVAGGQAWGILAYNSYAEMRAHNESRTLLNDFALIRIPDWFRPVTHPAVLDFGGPTGLPGEVARGDEVRFFGNTSNNPARDLRARAGVVESAGEWEIEFYAAPVPGIPGDSGSPVLTAGGEAAGVVSVFTIAPETGALGATDLPRALDYLHSHTNLTVELATWPEFDPSIVEPPTGTGDGAPAATGPGP